MRKLFVVAIVAVLAWYGYGKVRPAADQFSQAPAAAQAAAPATAPAAERYKCDGRTHCSEMRSCAEATYFIQHCPNTKMDGDGDGVPCERQWCGG